MTPEEFDVRITAVRAAIAATRVDTLDPDIQRAMTPNGRKRLNRAYDILFEALGTLYALRDRQIKKQSSSRAPHHGGEGR